MSLGIGRNTERRWSGRRMGALLTTVVCSAALTLGLTACSLSEIDKHGQEFGKTMDGLASGAQEQLGAAASGGGAETAEAAATPIATDSVYATFDDGAAQSIGAAKVDTSHSAYGYIGVKISDSGKFKVRLEKDTTYTYDLSSDGQANFYPLQMGNGSYKLTVFRNVTDNKYSTEGTTSVSVSLIDEFQPFLHPNVYSTYDENSKCVKQAATAVANSKTDAQKVSSIYKYLSGAIKYDYDFASSVTSGAADGYVPNPDSTLASKRGICFDYAALAAAMIRSQQIPCKLITGYVQPNDIYHSWNMIYLQDQGWITTEIKASTDDWGRIDVTFAATGGDSQFVGDGSNYTERYTY